MANEDEIVEDAPVVEEPLKEEPLPEAEKPAEPMVPLHRFREVNEKLEKVEKQIADLNQAKATPEGLSDQQKAELQAKETIRGWMKEAQDEEKRVAETEQRQFEKSVDEVLEVNPSVQKKDFVEFMEKNSEKYGIESVTGAMKLYLDLNKLSLEEREKGKKDIQRKPGLPHSEGAGGGEQAPAGDKNKSYAQVVQDAIRSLGKK